MTEANEHDEARPPHVKGTLTIMSPSQHSKCGHEEGCDRAWGYRYIAHLKTAKASSTKGTALHAVQEKYGKHGTMPALDDADARKVLEDSGLFKPEEIAPTLHKIGTMCQIGLRYLPMPGEGRHEHEFSIEIPLDGKVYRERGKIDVYDLERRVTEVSCPVCKETGVGKDDHECPACAGFGFQKIDGFTVGEHSDETPGVSWASRDSRGRPIPLVLDHKSTSDLKWKKTDAILRGSPGVRGDPQPAIYGWAACLDFYAAYGEWPEVVHFRWVYYSLKKNDERVQCVDLRMTPAEIWANLIAWLPDADRVSTYLDDDRDPNTLPINTDACKKFGGCDYGARHLNVCKITPQEKMRAAMTTNSLADKVNAFTNGASVFGAPPAAGPPPGGVFGTPPSAPPATASVFASPRAPESPRAPTGPVFGGAAATAPAPASSVFGAPPAAQVAQPPVTIVMPPATPAAIPSAFTQPLPAAAPPGDPRMATIPATITPGQEVAWLAFCDANGLDHRTGQPPVAAPVFAVAPAPQQPPPTAAPAGPFGNPSLVARTNEQGHTVAVQTLTSGAAAAAVAPAAEPPAPLPSRVGRGRGRPRKPDVAQAATQEAAPGVRQIVLTEAAIEQLIDFLLSLLPAEPEGV